MRNILYDHAGIQLADHKKDMAYNRLVKRLRELGLNSFKEYFEFLGHNDAEFGQFINAMTTNLTAFFREQHHFDYLADELIPELNRAGQHRLRCWSAGCSVGEETYSIAITLRSAAVDTSNWDMRILATDIDSKVLDTAERGVYAFERVQMLPEHVKRSWFLKGKGDNSGQARVRSELRDMISFKQLNLMQQWPMRGPFDFIFCRNVMIYFDKPTQAKLLNRMADLLTPNGLLFVGHSESPYRLTDRFQLIGQTIYRRVK